MKNSEKASLYLRRNDKTWAATLYQHVNMQKHIIRNQQMEITVGNEQDALALREQLGKTFNEQVLPKLDQLFSSLVSPDQHVRINTLEIDLGEIDPVNEKELFSEKFLTVLKETIEKKLSEAKTTRKNSKTSQLYRQWLETKPSLSHNLLEKLIERITAIMQKHIIRNQQMNVAVSSEQDVLALREQLGKTFNEQVLPKLDQLFSSLVSADQHLHFDQLEIDLGEIDPLNNRELFSEKFLDLLKAAIEKKLLKTKMARLEKTNPIASNENATRVSSQTTHLFQQCRYFLETGLLPWWAGETRITFFEKLEQVAREEPKQLYQQLAQLFNQKPQLVERYLLQFPITVREHILALALPGIQQELKAVFAWAKALIDKSLFKKLHAEWIAKSFNPVAFVLPKLIEQVLIIQQESIKNTALEEQVAFKKLKPALQAQILDIHKKMIAKTTAERLRQQDENKQRMKKASPQNESQKKPKSSRTRPDTSAQKTKKADRLDERRKSAKIRQAFAEGVQIQNAGLVLLTPFLSQFFKNIGLVEQKEFKDKASQERAVLLSQYLVQKDTDIPEYDLALNKLLCGLPQEQPVAAQLDINNKEKQEVEELLDYAIENWAALKKTSTDLLRSAFLQREGRLFIDEGNWTLQVDQQTHDILLNKIPWGFSLIKLPWMEHFLHVEWGY